MQFTDAHWDAFTDEGYAIVRQAIDATPLKAAQQAPQTLTDAFPDGWQRSKNELWREIKNATPPAFLAIASDVLDPLALEMLESVHTPDRIQFAQTRQASRPAGLSAGIFISMAGSDRRSPRSTSFSESR